MVFFDKVIFLLCLDILIYKEFVVVCVMFLVFKLFFIEKICNFIWMIFGRNNVFVIDLG